MIRNLKKGDLIGVAYSNYIFPAISMGTGRGGNPHFYMLHNGKAEQIEEAIKKGKKPYISYINRHEAVSRSPIVRMFPEDLNDPEKGWYEECLFILKKGNIL